MLVNVCPRDYIRKSGIYKKIGVEGGGRYGAIKSAVTWIMLKNFGLKRWSDFVSSMGLYYDASRRVQFGGPYRKGDPVHDEEVHTLPGTTFSTLRREGQWDPIKKLPWRWEELERWMGEFIVNIYHKRVHSSINIGTFREIWEGVSVRRFPRWPYCDNAATFFLFTQMLPVHTFFLSHFYVQLEAQPWVFSR